MTLNFLKYFQVDEHQTTSATVESSMEEEPGLIEVSFNDGTSLEIPDIEVQMDIDEINSSPIVDVNQALEFHNYHSTAFVETESPVPETVQHELEISAEEYDDCPECKPKIDDYKAEIALLKAQLQTERQQKNQKHIEEIALLQNQLDVQVAANKEMASTVKILSALWNQDEIEKLGLPEGGIIHKWSEKSLAKHIRLYYKVGTTAYQFLLDEGFPFASIRTIQRHVAGISVEPGILHDFVQMMRPKVESMVPQERFCSIAIDEMAIQAKRDFDPSIQAFIGHPTISAGPKLTQKRVSKGVDPDEILATHGLNFLLCGLSTKWTQLIAFEFSDQSTDPIAMRDLIHGVIRVLFEIGLTVVNITTDMATDNVAL